MSLTERRPTGTASLIALGVASVLLYGLIAFRMILSNAARDVTGVLVVFATLFLFYAAAGLVVRWSAARRRPAPMLFAIFAFAVLFRGLLLFAGLPHEKPLEALADDIRGHETGYSRFLIYDNDVWRYLWDGHLLASDLSPYAFTPREVVELAEAGQRPFAAVLADELWWDVLDNVSFQSYTTVYPPLAQGLFALAHRLAPGSVLVLKLLLVVVDLGTCALVMTLLAAVGRDRAQVVLYAWNPLVIKEFAGSGHVDALMVFWLTLSLLLLVKGRQLLALATFGLSVLSKIGSLALLVLFLRRTRPRYWPALAGILLAGNLPFAEELTKMVQGYAACGREWVFNSGLWAALRALAESVGADAGDAWAHGVTKTLALVGIVILPWLPGSRPRDLLQVAFVLLAGVVLLNPAVMPWYLLWALPLAVVLGHRSWLVLTALSLLSYLYYVEGGVGSWWLWLEYGIFTLVVAWEFLVWARSRRPLTP